MKGHVEHHNHSMNIDLGTRLATERKKEDHEMIYPELSDQGAQMGGDLKENVMQSFLDE